MLRSNIATTTMLHVVYTIITTTLLLAPTTTSFSANHDLRPRTPLYSSSQQASSDSPTTTTAPKSPESIHHALDLIIQAKAQTYFPTVEQDTTTTRRRALLADEPDPDEERFLTFVLEEHKPLGCTAEESLAMAEDGAKHVFVSKVTEGGNAERAGVEVGDVIVGLSGSFEEVVEVIGSGLDRVRSLVAGRQSDKTLILKIIRNTDVLALHEQALVDLCILPEGQGQDSSLVKCIEALYQSDYDIDDSDGPESCEDSDTECMLDTMLETWGDELDVIKGERAVVETVSEEGVKKKKPAPWSSRSSGSGTYVRDPKTGKMINLDDQ